MQGIFSVFQHKILIACAVTLSAIFTPLSQAKLVSQFKITDSAMFFNGIKVTGKHTENNPDGYDYVFGNALSPHGDCIKFYKNFVFMTWYQGGKENRHVMLSRLNLSTGALKTIQFPHRHTGFRGKWWLGETHNTIAVGISPKDDTIHLLYDMHRNGRHAIFADDYMRYSFSMKGAATVPDDQFSLDLFVNSEGGHYKHLAFPGINDVETTKLLTYPAFFTANNGDLFMKMRNGFSRNGKMLFARYDGTQWHGYTDFNRVLASQHGAKTDWGLYGDFKFVDGKLRIAFQKRAKILSDKFLYQNGIYYAYTDDPIGLSQWRNADDEAFDIPLADAELMKIAEPGDWAKTTKKDQVSIVHGFDFTVTNAGDEHFISKVIDLEFDATTYLHTYRAVNQNHFSTLVVNRGGQLHAYNDSVYLIGLENGRVAISKASAGKGHFTSVYAHDTGPKFDKSVMFAAGNRAYLFLKDANGTGDTRSLYLQIFELESPPGKKD